MKREIKFRYVFSNGKDYRFQEYTIEEIMNGEPFQYLSDSPFIGSKDYKMVEWFQYTGLKDKNWKEIFDGDILEDENRGHKYKVFSIQGGFAINTHHDDINKPVIVFTSALADMQIASFIGHSCVVIGNTYSNPELLEAVKP